MLSRTEVNDVITKIERIVLDWENDNSAVIRWRGERVRDFSIIADQLLDELDAFATMDIADDAKPTVLAVDELDRAIQQWKEAMDIAPESDIAHPGGNSAVWNAYSEVIRAKNRRSGRPKPEPIQTLIDQQVSDRQIAYIYSWVDADGSPDLHRVAREKAEPGSEYDPAKWVHPLDVKDRQEIERQWDERQKVFDEWQAKQSPNGPLTAPETIEELIRQRVGSQQISMMKNVTVDEVRRVAAEIGVPLDGQFVPRVAPADRQAAIRESEAEGEAKAEARMVAELSHSEIADMNERIVTCHLEGLSNKQIAEALKGDFAELSANKVAAIIKKEEAGTRA